MTESDQSSNACQSFTINVKAFKRLPQIFPFYLLFRKAIHIWVGFSDFKDRQVENHFYVTLYYNGSPYICDS